MKMMMTLQWSLLRREFTMATSQTAMPLLAPTDNDYTTPPHKVEDSANVSTMYDPMIHCLLCFIQYVNTTESWLTLLNKR